MSTLPLRTVVEIVDDPINSACEKGGGSNYKGKLGRIVSIPRGMTHIDPKKYYCVDLLEWDWSGDPEAEELPRKDNSIIVWKHKVKKHKGKFTICPHCGRMID